MRFFSSRTIFYTFLEYNPLHLRKPLFYCLLHLQVPLKNSFSWWKRENMSADGPGWVTTSHPRTQADSEPHVGYELQRCRDGGNPRVSNPSYCHYSIFFYNFLWLHIIFQHWRMSLRPWNKAIKPHHSVPKDVLIFRSENWTSNFLDERSNSIKIRHLIIVLKIHYIFLKLAE